MVNLGDDAALAHTQHVAATLPTTKDDDTKRWISAVRILMSHTSLSDSRHHICRAFDHGNALFRTVIDRIALYPDHLHISAPGITALNEDDLADLYTRLCQRDDLHCPLPDHGPGIAYQATSTETLHEFADSLIRLIADKETHRAANRLTRMAASGTAHNPNRLRSPARHTARQAARNQHEPLPAPQLRKLAADHALRVITNETQLLDVVMGALDDVQQALSGPHGMAILLWNRSAAKEVCAMWPMWEEDFSDLVTSLLRIHLTGRRIILNREVQVDRPGTSSGRTDIHIQATAPTHRPIPSP
ncbi:hypothetical protein [Streptomyces sp. NPDC055632]